MLILKHSNMFQSLFRLSSGSS